MGSTLAYVNMASSSESSRVLREPMCLIETDDSGTPSVNEATAAELALLDKPCVVVAIAGKYRTGKSYLMNRLAGHSNG